MLPPHASRPGMQVSRLGSGLKRRSQRNESANRGQKMSLRQIAKELGISPAYLSYMVNGKRPWRKDLYQRYMGGVNTFVNSDGDIVNTSPADNGGGNGGTDWVRTSDLALMKRPL